MSFPVYSNIYAHLLFFLPLATVPFDYRQQTIDWPIKYPQCAGYRQSPIAISKYKSTPIQLPPIQLGLYEIPLAKPIVLRNNGHTVKLDIPETIFNIKPFITGGLLKGIYVVEDIHFHWGSSFAKGSEHVVNGYRYDLEMHIVHRNARYADAKVARNYKDGLAVLAVLFKVVKDPYVFYPELNIVYNHLQYVQQYNATSQINQIISLGSLLGTLNCEDFYTYQGSLTTPPCSEAVTWIVFSNILPISYKQLIKFWNVRDHLGGTFVNVRQLQQRNHRKVYYRQKPVDSFPFNYNIHIR